MKVIQVIPGYADEANGPSYYFVSLCRALSRQGVAVEAFSIADSPLPPQPFAQRTFPSRRFPSPELGRSPELRRALAAAVPTADVVHGNSLWMMPNVYPGAIVAGLRRRGAAVPKLVTSPHGTLAGWALRRSAWKKRLVGWCGQFRALAATDLWHATCEKEYEEIRAAGYRQPVAIVPIGMDLPEAPAAGSAPPAAFAGRAAPRTLAFFGRIHKVKAVDRLALAWAEVAPRRPDWELVFAGPDCGMAEPLRALVAERRIPRVRLVGEITGPAKYDFLAAADLFALPSHTENFGVTVAESLACGTPVVVSTNTPWGGVAANGCGWFAANDVATLAATLAEATVLPREALRAMGARGRDWIRRDFGWDGVGRTMRDAYEWICRGGPPPDCVRT